MNLETGEVESVIKYENGAQVIIIGGNNVGRVGVIQHIEKHPSSFDIGHIKDTHGNAFSTRVSNVFVIGDSKKAAISLLPSKGIKLTLLEGRDKHISGHEA